MSHDIPSSMESRQLIPAISRALELGEGPAGLLLWLRRRTGHRSDRSPEAVRRLAGELASALRGATAPRREASTVLAGKFDTCVVDSPGC
jgi:hypothetical protein